MKKKNIEISILEKMDFDFEIVFKYFEIFRLKKISDLKPNKNRKKQLNRINFYSERKGNVAGEHSTIFTNNSEEIELRHKSFNRSIYANGAIKAAIWLSNKKKGFFNMFDVLDIS